MLQSKRCAYTSMKKYNKKSLNSYYSYYQILFINIILNINKLTNSSKLILKIKLTRAKLVKNAIDTVNNIVDTLTLLK